MQKQNNSSEEAPPQNPNQPQQNVPLLIRLSEACKRHAEFHRGEQLGGGGDGRNEDNNDTIPMRCKNDITSLKVILPKVEMAYIANDSNNNKLARNNKPSSSDVAHLCDFYQDVLVGGYCPYAPHIFNWGKGASEVLPRVYYLFQHLISKNVIKSRFLANKISEGGALKTEGTKAAISPTNVSDTIITTIVQLLHFVPEKNLQSCILSDLIQTLLDIGVLITISRCNTSDTNTSDEEISAVLSSNGSANIFPFTSQLTLFPRTIFQTTLKKENIEYILEIQSWDALLILYGSTFQVLQQLLRFQKKKRFIESVQVVGENYSEIILEKKEKMDDNNDDYTSPKDKNASSNDCSSKKSSRNNNNYNFMGLRGIVQDEESIIDLIASIGGILLSNDEDMNHITKLKGMEVETKEKSIRNRGEEKKKVEEIWILFYQAKIAAIQLYQTLLSDWHNFNSTDISTVLETTMLIIRSAGISIQSCLYRASKSSHSVEDRKKQIHAEDENDDIYADNIEISQNSSLQLLFQQYQTHLALLVKNVILLKPSNIIIPGFCSSLEIKIIIYETIFPSILNDCLAYMKSNENTRKIAYCSKTEKMTENQQQPQQQPNYLEIMLLRVIHTTLFLKSDDQEDIFFYTLSAHPTAMDIFFQCMNSSALSNIVIWIFAKVLVEKKILVIQDVECICSSAQQLKRQKEDEDDETNSKEICLSPPADNQKHEMQPRSYSAKQGEEQNKRTLNTTSADVLIVSSSKRRKMDMPMNSFHKYESSHKNARFVNHLFQYFLYDALHASSRISDISRNSVNNSSSDIENHCNRETAFSLYSDVVQVSSATKLLLCFTRGNYDQLPKLNAFVHILDTFISSMEGLCEFLMQTNFFSQTKTFQSIIDIIVDCCLHTWYAIPPIGNTSSINSISASFQRLSSKCVLIWVTHLASPKASSSNATVKKRENIEQSSNANHHHTKDCSTCQNKFNNILDLFACGTLYTDFEKYDQSIFSCDLLSFGGPFCLCSVFSGEVLQRKTTSRLCLDYGFKSQCILMMFHSLPSKARHCLLGSLYGSTVNQETESLSWDKLCLLRPVLQSPALLHKSPDIACILSFSFPMILTIVFHERRRKESNNIPISGGNLAFRVMLLANDFLNDAATSIIENHSGNMELLKASFVFISQLQWFQQELSNFETSAEDHDLVQNQFTSYVLWNPDGMLSLLRCCGSGDSDILDNCHEQQYLFTIDRTTSNTNNEYDQLLQGHNQRRQECIYRLAHEAEKSKIACNSSFLRYLRWKCLAWECYAEHIHTSLPKYQSTKPILDATRTSFLKKILLCTPFTDPNNDVRSYSAKYIGKILFANNFAILFALFLKDDEVAKVFPLRYVDRVTILDGTSSTIDNKHIEQQMMVDKVIAVFFDEINLLLLEKCELPSSESLPGSRDDEAITLSFIRSAMQALLSFCQYSYAYVETSYGRSIFDKSFTRIIKLWTSIVNNFYKKNENSMICDSNYLINSYLSPSFVFGGISRLCQRGIDVELMLRRKQLSLTIACIFRDVLVPSVSQEGEGMSDSRACEQRYRLLHDFFRMILTSSSVHRSINGASDLSATALLDFVEDVLPSAISQFVVEKNYEALQQVTSFKLYLLTLKRAQEKATAKITNSAFQSDDEIVLGGKSNFLCGCIDLKLNLSSQDLRKKTMMLCLAPSLIEKILPAILMKSDHPGLLFFENTVLMEEMFLNKIIASREQLILKGLIWELGHDPKSIGPATRAIQVAAAIRDQDSEIIKYLSAKSLGSPTMLQSVSRGRDLSTASRWVTNNFLYLLVNVVQYGWKTKMEEERIQSIRCLNGMLSFLLPSEASQYFPQIMASINAAISQGGCSYHDHSVTSSQLRFLAVKALSQFVRIVVTHNWENICTHLTIIVVSLLPVLTDVDNKDNNNKESLFCTDSDYDTIDDQMFWLEESSQAAVNLLKFLTMGEVGKHFAPYFNEIPFLPSCSGLESVHSSLKMNGVDFDNLNAASPESAKSSSETIKSQAQSVDSKGTKSRTSIQSTFSEEVALKKRLRIVFPLLSNENLSIRRVVLQHLTDLLRRNRNIFHSLIVYESNTTKRRYLTRTQSAGLSRGTVTEMVEILVSRCIYETDVAAKALLATCLGEVGAIGEHRLGEISMSKDIGESSPGSQSNSYRWRLTQAPWKSCSARYELKMIKEHLVFALKAAPTSEDQNKIAFTIQQLLVLLDASARHTTGILTKEKVRIKDSSSGEPGALADAECDTEMCSWLQEQLSQAGVMESVEPFWHSEFKQIEGTASKQPPFFCSSTSYYTWLSNLSRFMIMRSKESSLSLWKELFYACQTAVRTRAGIGIAEFIFPLLVLDRLCYGDEHDEQVIFQEIRDVLTFNGSILISMNASERYMAVNTAFMVIDTLKFWTEHETEERHRDLTSRTNSTARGVSTRSGRNKKTSTNSSWQSDDSIARIEDLIKAIPLSLQAKAAANVGMNARALRLLEMAARAQVVDQIFNETPHNKPNAPRSKQGISSHMISGIDLCMMKDILAALNDCETIIALEEDSFLLEPNARANDSIRQKEASGDWEAASRDYERAQQLSNLDYRSPAMQRGALACLLELGQFESVLNQVNGIIYLQMASGKSPDHSNVPDTIPLAIEAAWRLGRWSALSNLVERSRDEDIRGHLDVDDVYRAAHGEAMLALHRMKPEDVMSATMTARLAVMESLSTVARESYSRAYPYLVRLQCLREIEDAKDILCAKRNNATSTILLTDHAYSTSYSGWGWDGRLDFVSPTGEQTLINNRLALSRLAGDSALEGSLFLSVGKKARKCGLFSIAGDFLLQSEAAFHCTEGVSGRFDDFLGSVRMQLAKLKHDMGESTSALKMLGDNDVDKMADQDLASLRIFALDHEKKRLNHEGNNLNVINEVALIDRFVKRVLQSTQWMAEGGLKGGTEIMACFKVVHKLAPKMEKGHFQFAKYVDSLMQSRTTALSMRSVDQQELVIDDDKIRTNIICDDKICQKYILLAMEHYTSALKLGSKHVYQALPRLLSLWFDFTSMKRTDNSRNVVHNSDEYLTECKNKANIIIATSFKKIPAQIFYTAMPQLISRIIHDDNETAMVVQSILKRVLTKFATQAMWPLAWLRQSKNPERVRIGEEIFSEAQKNLIKNRNKKNQRLLVASKSLFFYLYELAKHPAQRSIKYKRWRGEVELAEFLPPIQGALNISLSDSSGPFSRDVPRMHSFSDQVQVMASKAHPKKIKAYAVDSGYNSRIRSRRSSDNESTQSIGEIHFLVKQEAKGDLRKDARVQDLNTVINRLMASSSEARSSSRSHRQLNLRTFAVTCLSEETGILEWVPDTSALRRIVCETYNPQASPYSPRRRGSRLGDFSDVALRRNYEKCHSTYFNEGNLIGAASMFEELCLKKYPPVLYWWFVQNFLDPHAWYEARTRFALSAAAWSAIGHVIGLGDRHSENILVDTTNGDCVHVDFDCIFDKGMGLPKPEVVPFRLTPNMVDAFGPTGVDGIYNVSLKTAMTTLRDNRDTLLSVLGPFLKDPVIDWKRSRSQQKRGKADLTRERAKRSLKVIDERLKGIYNLRNPNFKKVQRTDGRSTDQDDETTQLLPLSVEGQVHKMIAEATSHENLVQVYVGWMPWV